MKLIDQVYHRHQFETLATFTLITDRALICVTNIAFDRRYPEEVDRAERLLQRVNRPADAIGLHPLPFRPAIDEEAGDRINRFLGGVRRKSNRRWTQTAF